MDYEEMHSNQGTRPVSLRGFSLGVRNIESVFLDSESGFFCFPIGVLAIESGFLVSGFLASEPGLLFFKGGFWFPNQGFKFQCFLFLNQSFSYRTVTESRCLDRESGFLASKSGCSASESGFWFPQSRLFPKQGVTYAFLQH